MSKRNDRIEFAYVDEYSYWQIWRARFVRLDFGEVIEVVFVGDSYEYYVHWVSDNQHNYYTACRGNNCRYCWEGNKRQSRVAWNVIENGELKVLSLPGKFKQKAWKVFQNFDPANWSFYIQINLKEKRFRDYQIYRGHRIDSAEELGGRKLFDLHEMCVLELLPEEDPNDFEIYGNENDDRSNGCGDQFTDPWPDDDQPFKEGR